VAPPIAVQLWTVRELPDFPGVLRQISDIGYLAVEPFGLHGLAPATFRTLLDDLGLGVCSVHAPFPAGPWAAQVLDECAELGAPVLAWSLEQEEFATRDLIARGVERVNEGAANAKAYGMRVAYHNHWAEFTNTVDGRSAYQVLLDLLDPSVLIELDMYWTRLGGADPARVVHDLGDRVRFLHVKDGPADEPAAPMVPVGAGTLDIPAILRANPAVAWHIVELDRSEMSTMDALRESYRYLVDEGLSTGR
jgi:sugar phosphate isomerase/epimerase